MIHRNLEGLTCEQLYGICADIKAKVMRVKGALNFEDNYYWAIGSNAIRILHTPYNRAFNYKTHTLLGMEMRIDYSNPNTLEIREKPKPQFLVNIDPVSIVDVADKIKKGFESMFNSLRNIEIVNVIFNEPATIVIWSDGTKTVVKVQNGETFDKEKGFAMAICKKAFGNQGNYNEVFKNWISEDDK